MPAYEPMEIGYHKRWDSAAVSPKQVTGAKALAKFVFDNKATYQKVQAQTGVPWFVVGPIHYRESDFDFKTHLHNGDPLTHRTYHVPAGRPKTGHPPFEWFASAADALSIDGLDKVKTWSVERICYEWESYNGWGYLRRRPSPYLWSWTAVYQGGKFVGDGEYEADVWDKQAGCVAVLKELADLDPEVAEALKNREPAPPPDVHDVITTNGQTTVTTGGVIAAGGGAGQVVNTVITQPDKPAEPLVSHFITYGAIGLGVAVAVVAIILTARKVKLVNLKWSGQ
jgi:lysozyme family protein